MARSALIHYIAPSAISITPNANNSQRDLAVYLARGAKIKVYSPNAGIDTDEETKNYQEWTLEGRNRRLNDPEGKTPYTIFARLNKSGEKKGYLVFAPKNFIGWDEKLQKVWVDKYSSVTVEGTSVLYTVKEVEKKNESKTYWYIRLGDVSLPDEYNKRTVTLDTGILDTDQFNREWVLNPDALPLRVELDCTIDGKAAGQTPYVEWGKSAMLTANLIEGWNTDAADRVRHWTIIRNTGHEEEDALWNYPYAEEESSSSGEGESSSSDSSSSSDEEEKWPTPDMPHLMTSNAIMLAHLRAGADDFEATYSTVFTVTAWEVEDDKKDVPEKDDLYPAFETLEELEEYIQTLEPSEEDDEKDVMILRPLATATITIYANDTKLHVQIACSIDGQDVGQTPYVLWGKDLLMDASLIEGFDGDAQALVDHWTITRYTGQKEADSAWNYPQEESSSSSQEEEETPAEETTDDEPPAPRIMEDGSITLAHQRTGTDDFAAAVAAVFTITAWGVAETTPEPGTPEDDEDTSDNEGQSENPSDNDGQSEEPSEGPAEEPTPEEPAYVPLATGIITVFPETIERYTLALSSTVMGYNPQTKDYTPADGVQVRIRVTEQNGNISYITRGFLEYAGFTAGYAPVGTDMEMITDETVEEETGNGNEGQEDEQTASAWTPLTFTGGANDVAVATIPAEAFAIQQPMNVRLVNGASIVIELRSIAFVRDGEDSKEREWVYKLSNESTFNSVAPNANASQVSNEPAYEIIEDTSVDAEVGDGDIVIVRHAPNIYSYSSNGGSFELRDTGIVAPVGRVFQVMNGDDHYFVWTGNEWRDLGTSYLDAGRYYDDFVPDGWSDRAQLVSPNTRFLYACWRDYNREEERWDAFQGPIIWSAWGEKGIDGDGAQYVYKLFDHELTDDTTVGGVTTDGECTTEIPDVPLDEDNNIAFTEDGEIIPTGSGKNADWSDDPQAPTRDMPYCYCSCIKEINGVWGTFGKLALWSRWSENSIRIDLDNQADIVSLDSNRKVRFERIITTRARIYDGSSTATESVELTDTAANVITQLTFGSGVNAVAPILYDGSVAQGNALAGTARTVASGILVVQWTFEAGKVVLPVAKDIALSYRGIIYNALFSLASTDSDALWQVMPSPSEVSFALDATTNLLTPTEQYLKCGYTKQTGSGTESVAEATATTNGQIRHNDADSGMYLYYRSRINNAWGSRWTAYTTAGIPVSRGTTVQDYEFCITRGAMANDESNIEDREAVPVVKAAFNGKDAKDSEWAYILTTENVPPVIYDDENETDHAGHDYTYDGHLPKAKVSSGRIKGYTEGAANVAVECTATPQGISETWKYEWEIKRTKGDALNDGHRAWLPYSGAMALHKNYADEAYTVQADPPTVAFGCDVSGKSTDTAVKKVTLRMYKGKDPVSFTATIIATIRCFAWTSGTGTDITLSISTGSAWKYGSTTYYTEKFSPEVGDTVYDSSETSIGTVSYAESGYININGLTGNYVRQANVSLKDLSQDGGVGLTLNSTTGNVSRSLTIPVIGNRRGVPGSAGPMLYPAGVWSEDVTYQKYGDSIPYVYFGGNYYYLTAGSAQGNSQKPPENGDPSNEYWTLMTQVDVVFAKFGIMDYGKMASAVFCGDWMYSQYGKMYPTGNYGPSNPTGKRGTSYYERNGNRYSVNSYGQEPDYYTVDGQQYSEYDEEGHHIYNNGHWKYDEPYIYYDSDKGWVSAAPFAYFNPAYPQGGVPSTFAPNWAVNLKTGEEWKAGGNAHFDQNGNIFINDATIKGSLMYHKVVVEKSANGLSIARAFSALHTHTYLKGDIFVIGRDYSVFEISFPPAYLFKGARVKIIIGAAHTITYELFITRLSGEQAMIPADYAAPGWPPYNCFYAAIPVTSYGYSDQNGRKEMMQFSSENYHCLDFVSVANPDAVGTVPPGQPDAGEPYYVWMLIDAR